MKKFGGSSVATPEKMHGIVDRILRERQPDDRIVLVVSAMGDHPKAGALTGLRYTPNALLLKSECKGKIFFDIDQIFL